jgi:hypothetical protein
MASRDPNRRDQRDMEDLPCPPESGPSASDLRTSNDRIVSSKRDVRVFHKGNLPSSRASPTSITQSSIHSQTSFSRPLSIAVTAHASYSSRASGPITFSDSWRCITSHFAFAYRVAYLLLISTPTGLLGSHINLPYRAAGKHLGTIGE